MKLIEDLEDITTPFEKAVITIGNFDGVHIGHQALFHEVIERADSVGGTSVAMTFEPHPVRALKQNGHPPLITLCEQKVELIASSSIDVIIVVPFTREFASLTAREFVADVLIDRIGMTTIVVGKDYTFGRGREGDLALLETYSKQLGFELVVTGWIQAGQSSRGRISSTKIRELVSEGQLGHASQLLGRHYQIRGTVTAGRDRGGKLLGFPTANIKLVDELCPMMGVYAVTVECRSEQYNGVANIGYSPTFDDFEFTVEVHILDFDNDIYGEYIRVNFIQRIRAEIKFSNISELSEQIEKDIHEARKLLTS